MSPCPLDQGWRLWTMFHNRYDRIAPEAAARVRAARRAIGGPTVQTITPIWDVADDDASRTPMTPGESHDVPWRFGSGSPWHVHTEFTVNGDVVHIDICGADRYGPGSSWNETRIHVNGELRGRGGACGCSLGGGGSDGPAVALLADHLLQIEAGTYIRDAARNNAIRVNVLRLAARPT